MAAMTSTDELRRLLDERGVEYKSHYLNTSWYAGMKLYMATDDMDGTLTVDNLTPEQAIAATLGALPDRHSYEQRIEELERLWHAFENEVAAQSVEIAERDKRIAELENARAERTCRNDKDKWSGLAKYLFVCSECGWNLADVGNDAIDISARLMKRCPMCGAKVVGE
jgi:DNA-directed RNA polymerase subunit RPC12/RpoP